ncbi:4-alpha-glucanotransferase [Prochlorococcus sp. MIT 1307]|uniref:4-alpha-glucanotransferase n=1 Tax=Prochlorococcus sp. MIT 1307 TaxID=3096219 RepID=UPI002A75DC3C|nr:4-alpha-glucanotransferase [Prochlorococcus sp. MIT 1307]
MYCSSQELGRSIGVLLHPSALPLSPAFGSFGSPAREWIKALAINGIGVWQFLPLAPCDSTGSPYSSPSSFALNPCFLDAKDLVKDGFLSSSVIQDLPGSKHLHKISVNFSLAQERSEKLGQILREEWPNQASDIHRDFNLWCQKQFWLEDHVVFMEIRRQFEGLPWWKWPKPLALRNPISLSCWKREHKKSLLEHRLLQWHLDRQWNALRKLASELGVLLFGDLPFYVSRDSADVWSKRSLFSILPSGELEHQSGVPPDYFSATGQLWGTPVYKWSQHRATHFYWWRKRFSRHLQQVDLLRLDHFRALESYWAVPGNKTTAVDGFWKPSPGSDLLRLLRNDCGGTLPLVAEDLGVITSEVEELRDEFGLPGMKILQFGFNGDANNPYLPENIQGNAWVVYTGTHDNPTTLGWWDSLDIETKDRINQRSTRSIDSPGWKLIEMGLKTDARLVVAPLQDLLSLDNKARFNTPGTIENNWNWRLTTLDSHLLKALKDYGERGILSGRSLEGAIGLFDS